MSAERADVRVGVSRVGRRVKGDQRAESRAKVRALIRTIGANAAAVALGMRKETMLAFAGDGDVQQGTAELLETRIANLNPKLFGGE